MLTDLLTMTSQGRLDAMLTRTVTLDRVPEALTELSGGRVRGKIVYVPD
ncbi:zinc-binding dehydrogenase [Streptomyces sp. NPDC006372]